MESRQGPGQGAPPGESSPQVDSERESALDARVPKSPPKVHIDQALNAFDIPGTFEDARRNVTLGPIQNLTVDALGALKRDNSDMVLVTDMLDVVKQVTVEERKSHSLKASIDRLLDHEGSNKEDKAMLRILTSIDKDGDGEFSAEEVLEACRTIYRESSVIIGLKRVVLVQVVLIFLLLAAMFGISMAVYELSRETKVGSGGVMHTTEGELVQVGQQRSQLPLGGLLYLSPLYHQQVESISVKLDDTGAMLNLRVQEMRISPSPPAAGMHRPVRRQVHAALDARGILTTDDSPNSEGFIKSQHMRRPMVAALTRVLSDAADLQVTTETEVEVFGDQLPSRRLAPATFPQRRLQLDPKLLELARVSNASAARLAEFRRLAVSSGGDSQQLTVETQVQFSFFTLNRSLASLQGLQAALRGLDKALREESAAENVVYSELRISVTQVDQDLQPQFRIKAQSGAELLLFDAGHAELRLPDRTVQFCASCGECSALSVDDATVVEEAERLRTSDLEQLRTTAPDGRRLQLTTCDLCSADFPPKLPASVTTGAKQSPSGPPVLTCTYRKTDNDVALALDGVNAVQLENMKALRFPSIFRVDDYESVRQCAESAWLHKHTCQRSADGTVRFAFVRAPGNFGRCSCETAPGAATLTVPTDDSSAHVYSGTCDVEAAPRLYVGISLTALRDSDYRGVHYTSQQWYNTIKEINWHFSGHMTMNQEGVREVSQHRVYDDVRIRFFELGMRTLTSDTYYRKCRSSTSAMAMAWAPEDAATLNVWSCAGDEKKAGVLGWGYTTSVNSAAEGTADHKLYGVWIKDEILEGRIDAPHALPHELGHALGLKHTWGSADGSCSTGYNDHVEDTPRNVKVTGSACGAQTDTCSGSGLNAGSDDHNNVMSYCWGQGFTFGQMRRMMETTARVRPSMWLRGAFWPLAGCTATASATSSTWTTVDRDECVEKCIPDPYCVGIRFDADASGGNCQLLSSLSSGAAAAGVECWWRKLYQEVMESPRRLRLRMPGVSPFQDMVFEKEEWPLVRGRPAYKNVDAANVGKYVVFNPSRQRWQLQPETSGGSYAFINSDAAHPHGGVWELYRGGSEYMERDVTVTVEDADLDTPGVNWATVCGDNRKDGSEACDDGNFAPFDSCDPQCKDGTQFRFQRTERGMDAVFEASAPIRFAFVDYGDTWSKRNFYGGVIVDLPDAPHRAVRACIHLTVEHPAGSTVSGSAGCHGEASGHAGELDGVARRTVFVNIPKPLVDDAEGTPSFAVELEYDDGTTSERSEYMCWTEGC